MVSILCRPESFVALALIPAFALVTNRFAPAMAHDAVPPFRSPESTDLEAACRRVGLDPGSLAAAGVPAGSVSAIVNHVKSYLNDHPGALSGDDNNYASVRAAQAALQRKVASGLASQNEILQYTAATSALSSASASRDALLLALFDAGTSSLSAAQKQTLQIIRANSAFDLSPEYLAAQLSQDQFVILRDALAAKKIALKMHESPDVSVTATIASFEQNASIATAKTNLVNGGDACSAAFDTALSN